MDLALNNPRRLIYHKITNKQTKQCKTSGKATQQSFWINQPSPPSESALVFLKWEKILLKTEQCLACSVHAKCSDSDENQTPSRHHGVWGGYDQWWRYTAIYLPTRPQNQHRDQHQVPEGSSAPLDWECSCWKTLRLAIRHYVMPRRQENSVLTFRIFLRPHHLKHLAVLLPHIVIPFIVMCGAWFSEMPTILRVTPKMNWKQR